MNLIKTLTRIIPAKMLPVRLQQSLTNYSGIGSEMVPIYTGKNRRVAYQLQQRRRFRSEFGQAELKRAIDMAEDPINPRREMLITIYKEVFRDLHLRSQIRTAINKILEEPWAVVKTGTTDIDKEATKLLQKAWFEDFRYKRLEAEFWGHSLIQFDEMVPNDDPETRALAPFVFKSITLIPRENVEPVKGHLLLWPSDIAGIPYRENLIGDWLLECGDPQEIGLLHACARYSIFKKFGLSDWSRSGEKWGDPLLVIRSSSNDDKENDKKAEFAANFGNNGWAILDDDDEVDILERQNDKGYAIFMDMCKYLDEENSKGVNGQTGSSDQKSFVGAANVHERILETYTNERLRSEMYYINETVFPFLIGKGYNLQGYEFKPLQFMRELVIPGTEPPVQPDPNNPQGTGGSPAKKSLSLSEKVEALYHINCTDPFCGHQSRAGDHHTHVVLSVGIDPIIQRSLKRLYDRKTKRGDVDTELVDTTIKELYKGIQDGWQKDIQKVAYASPEHLVFLQMRYNTAITAIFKNHTQNLEILRELFDDQGNVRSWAAFKKAALKISQKYNKEWLQAEYQTAVASARMARKWQEFAKKPEGKLVYKTIGDGRVREEHRVLDGITKPVTDAFWNNYYPPNGWRCRCYVRWVPGDEPDVEPTELPQVNPGFLGNVGKTGEIFTGEHPYFDEAGSLKPTKIKLPVSPDRMKELTEQYRRLSRNESYSLAHADNLSGGFVFQHRFADKKDLASSLRASRVIASEPNAVLINAHKDIGKIKNPELTINGILSDVKTPLPETPDHKAAIKAFEYARDQGLSEFVLELTKDTYDWSKLVSGLFTGFHNKKSIERVLIVWKGRLATVTRHHFQEGTILKQLDALK